MINKTKILLPGLLAAGILTLPAQAAEIVTDTARLQAMDKITGRVSVIEAPVNAEVQFGSFSIVVRDCRTRPPEETPENFAFVDVADTINGTEKINIFKGWMFSSSPALNAVEHPVYDVWLLNCFNREDENFISLSTEELYARDQLPMQRNMLPPTTSQEEDVFAETNLSGEPIDLLPAAVREAGLESAAEDEVIPLPTISIQKEEHAPQSLLNIPSDSENEINENEIKATIEIKENAEENEIKSSAHFLSLPATEEKTAAEEPVSAAEPQNEPSAQISPATPDDQAFNTPQPNNTAPVSTDISTVNVEETKSADKKEIVDTPQTPLTEPENTLPADEEDEFVLELEKQLSQSLLED